MKRNYPFRIIVVFVDLRGGRVIWILPSLIIFVSGRAGSNSNLQTAVNAVTSLDAESYEVRRRILGRESFTQLVDVLLHFL